MKAKAKFKLGVDVAMTFLMLGQMGYHMMDNRMHEWTGITLIALFILHHVLNSGWHRGLRWGRYPAQRILLTAIDVLLTLTMLTVAVSAVLVSRSAFDFLGLHMRAIGRRIHMPATMWFFVLIGLHMGLHLQTMLAAPRRKHPWMQSAAAAWLGRLAAVLIFAYGAYVFFARELYMELFMLREFAFLDYGEPLIAFFADYAAITAAWALLSYALSRAFQKINERKRGKTS